MTSTSTHAAFVGSVPRLYHEHLGPLFFVPYARDLAARLTPSAAGDVLELACGTGILTSEVLARLAPAATLTATDLNDAMIAVARSRIASPPGRVRWQTADATALPFADGSFDHVVCQFGVMFFPDKIAAAREVRRVLRRGGPFLFNVWGTLDENPIARVAHDAVATFFSSNPPVFYQVPFGYADRAAIRDDLRSAGFTAITIDTVDLDGHVPSARGAAIGLVQGTPIVAAIAERASGSLDEMTNAVAEAIGRAFGDRDVRVPMRAHVIVAR